MTLEQELRLSYYQQVADISPEHGVYLVQHVKTKKFYVKKLLTVYNAHIYRHLLMHPIANTPRILLAEEDGKVLTVIEEYIHGDTLEERLAQGSFTQAQVIDITLQLCRILAAFHSCNPPIVNRDIKPSNIKITPDGVVKLLDLNAAKWSNDQAEKDTVLLGTQGYAAPEQYGFGPSNVLTDIYAVGVLMNVMATGVLPNRVIAGGQLGKVIRRCVELSPSGRYQSVPELMAVLQKLLGRKQTPAEHNRKRLLPPGFRGNNAAVWILSAMGYAFLLFLGMGLTVKNAGPAELLINRCTCTAMLLSMVFFNGNYLEIQQRFVLTRSSNRWLRWLGMAVIDGLLLVLWMVVMILTMALIPS